MSESCIFVTGASGYVGSRLIPELLRNSYSVKAVSRSPSKLDRFPWSEHERVECRQADALDYKSIESATENCIAAYHLIHSMGQGSGDFEEADKKAARNMAKAASFHELERIVYLGGIKPPENDSDMSKHRRSRLEVEEALASGSVPVTTFRAAMIVGSGSASFEMLRYSLERLPSTIITNPYIDQETQPIAISNVLTYLSQCLEHPETRDETFDIGGPDVLTNRELMKMYSRIAGLSEPRIVATQLVPMSVVALASGLITPLPMDLVYPLVIGGGSPSVCRDKRIREIISQDLLPIETAMERALEKSRLTVETEQHEVKSLEPEWPRSGDPEWSGGSHYQDRRTKIVQATPEEVWDTIIEVGGKNGLFFAKWFRDFVGWIDKYLKILHFPDTDPIPPPVEVDQYLDCWKVLSAEKPNRLKLRADVNIPGKATYEFQIKRNGDATRLVQTAQFRPRGFWGRVYWRVLSLFHIFSFPLTIKNIAKKSLSTS